MKSLILALALFPLPAAAQTGSTVPAAGRPIDLPEAYKLALARSEEIAISGASYEETLAKVDELWSHVMPSINVMGTESLQQVPKGQSNQFLQANREQGWVNLHQPLFSGFREFIAYRAAKDTGRAAELRLERAKHLLYQDVARAYLDLLAAQDQIRIQAALVEITENRLKDLREFRRVGRARQSELLAAESQQAQIVSQLEQARAREGVAQFKLGFLTGLDEALAPRPVSEQASVPELERVLGRARSRPDVEARRDELSAARSTVKVYSRQRWPTISADANYYFQRPPSFTSEVKWDATITGSFPIYSGGGVTAQIKQAEARLKAGEAALSQAARNAELEAKSAHRDLLSSVTVVSALDKAAALAEANAKAQAEDYRLGQVTNLDVLGSLNTLQQTRLQQNAARIDACWSRVRLEVAAGVPGGSL